ncbi:hypothetical protein FACS189499_02300 [Clostridia bacterium]|nr:hypothetical protein FACS189499_02300 [Clostridia bacterium]
MRIHPLETLYHISEIMSSLVFRNAILYNNIKMFLVDNGKELWYNVSIGEFPVILFPTGNEIKSEVARVGAQSKLLSR